MRRALPGLSLRNLGVSALAVAAWVALSTPSVAAELTKESTNRPITFTKDIASIFQEKCQNCHRKGEMAPMSLVTYEETRPWAKAIKERVVTRQMPPWHLDKTVGIQDFQNDISLSDDQISAIAHWVDAGAPQGDPKDMPAPKEWPNTDGWQLAKQFGAPDFVLKSDEYTMPAKGQDVMVQTRHSNPGDGSRAGCAPSRCGRRRKPDGRITHHALAYLQQDEGGSSSGSARSHESGASHGMGDEQAISIFTVPTPASCWCPARRSRGRFIITRWATRFATMSNWLCISIPKVKCRSIGPA